MERYQYNNMIKAANTQTIDFIEPTFCAGNFPLRIKLFVWGNENGRMKEREREFK